MSEIATFTGAELMDPNAPSLPGWREPGSMPSILRALGRLHSWTPALSVSVFRDHPDRPDAVQALTLKRGAATTHSDILSTLTGAFPPEILPLIVRNREPFVVGEYPSVMLGAHGPNPQESAVIATYARQLEGVPDQRSLLSFLCHDIMARKLGRPDLISMQSDEELGTVSLARMAIGVSYVGDNSRGEPRYERLLLAGLAFMLHPHRMHVFDPDVHEAMSAVRPEERRYSHLGWTDTVQSFPDAVRAKNVIDLAPYMPEEEAVTVCARGQCLAMTSELIKGPDLMAHLGRLPLGETVDYGGQPIGDPYGKREPARKL